jgi:hypothetical protein
MAATKEQGNYIQADETPVDVQTRDGRSRNHPDEGPSLAHRRDPPTMPVRTIFLSPY